MNRNAILVIIVLVLGAGALAWYFSRPEPAPAGNTFCTMEAKLCPDGSSVGRVPPTCEFAACPTGLIPNSWSATSTNSIKFNYPESIDKRFISLANWPPQLSFTAKQYSCNTSSTPQNFVSEVDVNGSKFCLTQINEGAAGSTYSEYTYQTAKNNGTLFISFTLRYPQCLNYDEPNKSDCEKERQEFNLNDLVGKIAQSAVLP